MAKQSIALLKKHQLSASHPSKRGQSRIWAARSRKLELSNSAATNDPANRLKNHRIRRNSQIRHNRQIQHDRQNWRKFRVIWTNPPGPCSGVVFRWEQMQLRSKRLRLPAFALHKPSIFSQFATRRCSPTARHSTHMPTSSLRLGWFDGCTDLFSVHPATPHLSEKSLITGLHLEQRQQISCSVTHYDLQNRTLGHRR
jgi:hypothetical protein